MWHEEQDGRSSAAAWNDRDGPPSRAKNIAEVPFEKTPQAVLREIGLILAGTLSIALIVNIVLAILHIA
jgi:hypothetical protein